MSELPPPGSGPGADPVVQRVLESAVPADLPARTEQNLVALGRSVWTAEVTRVGRQQWPAYFTTTSPTAAGYTRVRIQAAIARRDPDHQGGAVVHLVWAGADPSGTYLDGRSAAVRFAKKEENTWNPVR
ncbi:hypothetical protein OHA27_38095 [Streptomyces sp. NBC_01619]|uniref:hypothetical protein n=1 Tax=Streptomyces sp. NBC_01619 TaxID=2975901 RepID=UPI0022554572|nr:hypothetical protein [Streptomyces sp. NBC_01619]MCX4515932.1 hypothetical protein [Streptomyces sp. NBC_01619]